MPAQRSLSSHGPSMVNRWGQALLEEYSELSEAHLYSKSASSLSVSYRNSPGQTDLSWGKLLLWLLPVVCFFMLGNIVNFAPREQIQASPECSLPWCTIPLYTQYIKVKHCLLLNGPIFYLHFLHDNFNDNALLPSLLVSFPFSFPESISSGLMSFPVVCCLVFCGFFFFSVTYFLQFILFSSLLTTESLKNSCPVLQPVLFHVGISDSYRQVLMPDISALVLTGCS